MPALHLVVRDARRFGFTGLMRRNLGGFRAAMLALRELVLNLLAARTRRVQVVLRVAADLRLAARAALDLVAQRLEPRGQLRPVHRRRVCLALVELARLQRADVAVLRAREVEDDDVGVELGRGVAVDRSGAVVLELRRDPLARGLGRMIPPRRACT